jgi:putative transposase
MENSLLLPRNKKKFNINRKISQNRRINAPNKLWQFDIKTGYIHGENKHFYFLAIIDVFNKEIKGYHLGYQCKAVDLKVTIEEAIRDHGPNLNELVIRSDNGPQMTSNQLYQYLDEIGLEHEFIPVSVNLQHLLESISIFLPNS